MCMLLLGNSGIIAQPILNWYCKSCSSGMMTLFCFVFVVLSFWNHFARFADVKKQLTFSLLKRGSLQIYSDIKNMSVVSFKKFYFYLKRNSGNQNLPGIACVRGKVRLLLFHSDLEKHDSQYRKYEIHLWNLTQCHVSYRN